MADVLIVCVREDEPQAKALADMFEAAGFSIGGAPSNDAALRSSGAGVVVWSQASIRSRPFLDAAQRVINSGKAVVASLIEPPPPSSIGDSPAFDLSHWDGDPNDPSLDSLFFAVDRMVNSARAAVGASPAQPAAPAYDPPPPPRAAPTRSAGPARSAPPREPAYREPPPREPPPRETPPAAHRKPQAPDPLEAEAEHWRAIRDSRDPADFMDYLARYGADGAFAEVAEIKLKRLTGGAEMRAPPRAPTRAEPPQRRASEPPPMRRAEPPHRRMETTVARPPIDRGFDRAELREPPRPEGGGALRTFMLIGLLGAVAAGGYFVYTKYFQDALPSGQQSAEADGEFSTAPSGEPELGEPESLSLSEVTAPSGVQGTRRTPPPPVRRQPPPQQAAARQAESDRVVPAPVTSWNNDAASGGPVSLVPSQSGGPAPLTPSETQPEIQLAASPANTTPQAPPTRVVWTQTFSARRMAELYPSSAAANGTGGRVVLECVVQPSLGVACTVISATPAGAGFDRAALRLVASYRARPTRSDGSNAIGERTRIAVNFQPPGR